MSASRTPIVAATRSASAACAPVRARRNAPRFREVAGAGGGIDRARRAKTRTRRCGHRAPPRAPCRLRRCWSKCPALEHARDRRIDADAVGRSAVGDPPCALVQPELAMPAARVHAVDDDVAGGILADHVAAAGMAAGSSTWRTPPASSISIATLWPASGVTGLASSGGEGARTCRSARFPSDQRPTSETSYGRAAIGSSLRSSAMRSSYAWSASLPCSSAACSPANCVRSMALALGRRAMISRAR